MISKYCNLRSGFFFPVQNMAVEKEWLSTFWLVFFVLVLICFPYTGVDYNIIMIFFSY